MSQNENYINDIATSSLYSSRRDLEDEAAIAFGKLNGWTFLPHYHFNPEDINKKYSRRRRLHQPRYSQIDNYYGIIDHGIYYKRKSKPIAIVAQPYNLCDPIEKMTESFNDLYALDVYVPPDPKASFWFPGGTFFVVLAAPNTDVKWLPEQDGRYIHRWPLRDAALEKARSALKSPTGRISESWRLL
jgi:hypothetical protein